MTLSYRHLAALSLLSLAACAAETDEDVASAEGEIGSVKSYFSDAKRLDLGDLTRVSVGFATDGLNDALSTSSGALRGGLRFEAPSVFAPKADPNLVLPDRFEVKALDSIVSGLAAQFGEKELGTEVNAIRLKHLESTADDFFVESAFTTSAGIGPSWSFGAGGFNGTSVTLGFNADAALTSRVIVATKNESLGSLLSAPLEAVKASRGFVYPRTMADIKGMKPGEMFALRGAGQLGANFGIGAPIFVTDPGSIGYRIVVSAGVAGVVKGQIDVQLVRLEGDEVVVDVGVEKGQGVSFRAGIGDEFGIKGICDDGQSCLRDVDLGGHRVGLKGIVEKAVEKQVNKYLSFSIAGSASSGSSRVSLSRFRVHMDKGGADTQKALEQLLKFDLRLAQAMYNRDLDQREPAVFADFDAVRAATTTTRNFGFELLGMNIYHRAVVKREGTFVLQTPDGAKSILFDHLAKDGGWFQRKHGFSRTGIAAESIDESSPTSFKSEANLFIQTLSSDKHMDNDFALDNIDALIRGVAGQEVVDTLDVYGNDMERTLWQKCPVEERRSGGGDSGPTTKHWDEKCNVRLLDDPAFIGKKTQGLAAIEPKISRLAPDFKALVRKAAEIRLTLQSTGIHGFDALSGPGVAVTTEARFDDKALEILASRSKDDYLAAMRGYLSAVDAKRREVRDANDRLRAGLAAESDSGRTVEQMANIFTSHAANYRAMSAAEKALPQTLAGKRFVSHPLAIRFTVEGDARKMLEGAVIDSAAHQRALTATRLFDDLKKRADGIDADLDAEHATFYPLLTLVPAQNLEVALTVDTDVRSSWFVKRERFIKAGLVDSITTAKGAESSTISAGMFDLRSLIESSK
ncbi:MAG: hypothetical protein KIT84_27465 [Labilithrix sp.]|nr:hypothetical protein [Labilithrix sp.]MCW5814797.1 hypothetical protein [Labilithrix sp.]